MIDEKKLNRDDLCDICRSADCANCFSDEDFEKWEEQLEKLYGGKMPLDKVVENLNRIVQNGEGKLDYTRILTNAEAEKWDKWKDLEKQGRLIEQKHGRWELHGNDDDCGMSYFCSECGDSFDEEWFYVYGQFVGWKYCPNCGAKMDEVAE